MCSLHRKFHYIAIRNKGGHAQTMWTAMGEGGSWNVHFTNKAYLVKLSTKGEGGQNSPKIGPHGLCMAPKKAFKEPVYIIFSLRL